MTGICALILSKHPELIPFQLKSVLFLTANERGRWGVTGGDGGDLRAAVAAGVVGSSEGFHNLLAAITEVARGDLRCDGVVDPPPRRGGGRARVRGDRGVRRGRARRPALPSGTGIAGWVLSTRTPLILDDVQNDPRFAKDFAADTGYVPQGLMAVPLLYDERALGVLEVLDRPQQSAFSLQEMELLGLFANQAAIALDLLQRAREADAVLNEGKGDLAVVARLAAVVTALEDNRREAGLRLLGDLAETLAATSR